VQITQDQVELKDLVRRFFAEKVTPEYLRGRLADATRHDPKLLEALGELGLDEGFGADGAPFSFVELALVAEEAGRVLLPEPLVERLFGSRLAPRLLASSDAAAYRTIISESDTVALAPTACCQIRQAETGSASGEVSWAFGLEGAGKLVAFGNSSGAQRVVLTTIAAPSVEVSHRSSLDLTVALSSAVLNNAEVVALSPEGSALIEDCVEILKASEVFGVCERVVEMACEYVKTREQFGVPVGGFQAIQHKLADIYAQTEALGAICRFASWAVEHSPEQRRLTARAAVSHAATIGSQVCEVALQCHGGIGFTWEYDLHLYLRRAKAIESAFPFSEARADEILERARG
jgi:alkylation response protein AidB-like acyl-CoA dehydrogenase